MAKVPSTPEQARSQTKPIEKKPDVKKSRVKAIWESLALDAPTALMMFK